MTGLNLTYHLGREPGASRRLESKKSRLKPTPPRFWSTIATIRTVAEVALEFAVFTREPFGFQRIAVEASRLLLLG